MARKVSPSTRVGVKLIDALFLVPNAADIWSVGCVMAELLTGQVLFPGSDCMCFQNVTAYSVTFIWCR